MAALLVAAAEGSLFSQGTKGATLQNVTPAVIGEQYAVVVGVSKYKYLPQLQFADADARCFANFLINDVHVDPSHVYPFINDSANLEIMWKLDELKKQVKKGDRVYIYFSGHGDIETAQELGGLLLLCESDTANYYLNPNGYIQEKQLRTAITRITGAGAEVVFIADACHSGKLSGGTKGAEDNLLALRQEWSNETKIFSCQANELSLEGAQWGKGRGLFSWHLVNALKGAADSTDTRDNKVTLYELQKFLQDNVRREAKPNRQTPFVVGDLEHVLCDISTGPELSAQDKLLAANFSGGPAKGNVEMSNEQRLLNSRFEQAVKDHHLSSDKDGALGLLQQMKQQDLPEAVIGQATRNLVAALLKQSTELINPLLSGDAVVSDAAELNNAAADMQLAMDLLGSDHYLWPAFESRRLFLKSVALTMNEEDLTKKENLNQAIQWLEQSVKWEPYAYYSYFQLGVCYYYKKLSDKSIEYFNKYKSYLPKDPDTYNNIGLAYFRMGDLANAVKYIGQAVGIDSTRPAYFFNMGNIMCNAGDFVRGIYAYNKALKLKPDDVNVLFNLANAYNYAKQNDSAYKYYNLVLKQEPNDARTWQYLGNTQCKMNKPDEALASYTRSIKLGNTAFRVFYNMACLLSVKNDKDNALDFLEEALKRGMNDFVLEIYREPDLNNIRGTARYTALMKKYASK